MFGIDTDNDNDNDDEVVLGLGSKIVACMVFGFFSCMFLFPSNLVVPFNRTTTAFLCAILVYFARHCAGQDIKLSKAIDFEVLVVLAGIMMLNHLLVHQPEANKFLDKLTHEMRTRPVRSLWLVSALSFCLSPLLTNDGVCLLLVAPLLRAFRAARGTPNQLDPQDQVWFMLALSCSANIGSVITFVGNPQNLIIAQQLKNKMSAVEFLGFLVLPAVLAALITTGYVHWAWQRERRARGREHTTFHSALRVSGRRSRGRWWPLQLIGNNNRGTDSIATNRSDLEEALAAESQANLVGGPRPSSGSLGGAQRRSLIMAPITTLRTAFNSPFPGAVFLLVVAMVVNLYAPWQPFPIAGVIMSTVFVMLTVIIFGNQFRSQAVMVEEHPAEPTPEVRSLEGAPQAPVAGPQARKPSLSRRERIDLIDKFFDQFFASIDYFLLIIFIGTFVVVENFNDTGIPPKLWRPFVGAEGTEFWSAASRVLVTIFISISSQFLGNVAIVTLAKDVIEDLHDTRRERFAWLLTAWVCTIAGNLTLTGSAANIIVAEKSKPSRDEERAGVRHMDFFTHLRVCFVPTLVSIAVGLLVLSAEFSG